MDPVSVIVAALVAGAAAGGTDAASSAIKDAYAGLKGLLVGRFRKYSPDVAAKQVMVLDEHAADPGTYEKPMGKAIEAAGADQDEQILAAAQLLLERADPHGAAASKYDLRGAQGVQAGGSGNTQTNTFTNN